MKLKPREMLQEKIKRLHWRESYLKYLILDIYFGILMVFAIVLLVVSNRVSNRSQEPIDQLIQISAVKVSVALTLVSFVIILIAVIGCCATYTKRKLILVLFCILLVIIVFIEIFSAYNSFYYNSKLKDNKIDGRFTDLTEKYEWFNETSITSDSIDAIQSTYNCCGTYSFKIWDRLRPSHIHPNTYPLSCCAQILMNTSIFCTIDLVNGTNSCFDSFSIRLNEIKNSVVLMAGFSIANSLIKIIGIPLVWYFGRQLPENFIV